MSKAVGSAVADRGSSADNVLALVRAISGCDALRVSEAAQVLEVAPSTAHRLLVTLCRQGFAEQDSRNGPYRPGPVLRELRTTGTYGPDLREVARPALEELTNATAETVSIGVLDGQLVRFIDGIEGSRTVRVGNRIGVRLPAHCTAAGKAMLAALAPVELERRYAGHDLELRTEASPRDWNRLSRELAAIRKAGFAMNAGEAEPGVCAVGAAILDGVGAPVAAINLVLPASRMPTKRIGRQVAVAVVAAAQRITARLNG